MCRDTLPACIIQPNPLHPPHPNTHSPVCPDMLARAMRMNVKRHPNLRSHLVPGGLLKSYPFSRCPKVKVQSVCSDDVLAWTETMLNANVKVKEGRELYMWSLHLHYTPASDRHHLVLFMHHAISDGDSINHLLQSLVKVNVSSFVIPLPIPDPPTHPPTYPYSKWTSSCCSGWPLAAASSRTSPLFP